MNSYILKKESTRLRAPSLFSRTATRTERRSVRIEREPHADEAVRVSRHARISRVLTHTLERASVRRGCVHVCVSHMRGFRSVDVSRLSTNSQSATTERKNEPVLTGSPM